MSRPYRSVYTLSLAHAVTDIFMPVIIAILPLLIAERGLSFFLAGLLVTSYNLTSSATQPVFGWLSDYRGIQVHVSISLLISAVFISLLGVISAYPLMLLCASLAAIGHACFHPNALSIVSRAADNLNRARITALFVVGGNVGYAIGPLLAGALVYYLGLPGLLLMLPPAVIMALVLRYLLPPISRSGPSSSPEPFSFSLHALRPVTSLFAASTLRAWAVFSAIAFFPPLLISRGYDLFTADLMVTVMLFAGVAGQVTGGILADRYGKKEFTITGLLCSIPFAIVFLSTSGVLSIMALILFGFFLWSNFAVTVAMSHELLPKSIGVASGLMLGLAIGAGGVGVAVSGILADQYSLSVALGTIPILILASALLMLSVQYPRKLFFMQETNF